MGANISRQHGRFIARSSAVLTNSAVATKVLQVSQTLDGWVGVEIDFTVGSLTNGIFDPQVSNDGGTTWRSVTDPGKLTLTADSKSPSGSAFAVCCKGFKQFRVAVTGTGTVTNSLAAIWFGYQEAGGAAG